MPRLVSLSAETSSSKKPKFVVGDFVRIVKKDEAFRRGYKLSFMDEVFEITDIPTLFPPTYSLIDGSIGPASFGSPKRLQTNSNLKLAKIRSYQETKPSFTKYHSIRLKFRRLKVIVKDINRVWSLDLTHVDKLADYNRNVKYLLVAVDCLSRYLRVKPMKTKYATEAAEVFKKNDQV